MVQFGVIADDFTGACDVGIQFKKYGLETLVLTSTEAVEEIKNSDVVVIDTESRNDSADAAYNKARNAARALKKTCVRLIYKKIDSTLRGNIGAELDAIMDELNLKAVVIAPAFPAANRTTVDGLQLVNGTPLDKTEFAYDPVNPVRESHIPTLIQHQTQRKIGTLHLSKVREEIKPLRHEIKSLIENGCKILVADAEIQNDLKTIAKAALDLKILLCGSAGLAEGVSFWLASSLHESRLLVVSGSVNTVTLNQISAAEKMPSVQVLEPDLSAVLIGGEKRSAEAKRLVNDAKESAAKRKDVIVRLAKSRDEVFKIQQLGRKLGMKDLEASESMLSFLGETSKKIIDSCKITGLILVGGDTAINVMKAIEARGIKIVEEVSPGIPMGEILGGRFNGLLTVTKAGGFGREDALTMAMKRLKEKLSAHPNLV